MLGFFMVCFCLTSVPATYLFMAACSAKPAVYQFPNQAGMEPTALAMEAWGLNQWAASKVPMKVFSFDHTSTFNLLILAINAEQHN